MYLIVCFQISYCSPGPAYSPTDTPTSPTHSDLDGWETFSPPYVSRSRLWDLQFELIKEIKADLNGWNLTVETSSDELEVKRVERDDNLRGQYNAQEMYDYEVAKLKDM